MTIVSGLFYNLSVSLFVLISLEIGLEQIFREEDEEVQQTQRDKNKAEIEKLYRDTT
jgi:hypothetical protein